MIDADDVAPVVAVVLDQLRTVFDQQNAIIARLVEAVERLTDRVEVLELERLHAEQSSDQSG